MAVSGTRVSALLVPALLVFVGSTTVLAAKTDVLLLRNGDRITGEVTRLERGRLAFKTDDMGTLDIEWSKIKAVTAAALYEVEDALGRQYVGSLQPGSAPGLLNVVGGIAPGADIPMVTVVRIGRVGTSWWGRLKGAVDAGASYSKASQLLTIDVAASATADRPRFSVGADASATLTQQPDVADTRRSNVSLALTRRFEQRWFAFVKGIAEQNQELGFDLRTSAVGGIGRYLVRGAQNELLVGGGASLNREWPVDGKQTVNSEALATLRFDRYAYDFPHVDITAVMTGYASLSGWGRTRFDTNWNLRRELFRDFYITLRGYTSFDSQPPSAVASRTDYGLTLALGWSF